MSKPCKYGHTGGRYSSKGALGKCKDCAHARHKKWREKQPADWNKKRCKKWMATHPNYNRWAKIQKKYGLTKEQYTELLLSQNGNCPICGDNAVAVDHCHKTGLVRGILCHQCNKGLGHFLDSPIRLLAAAKYLSTHQVENHPNLQSA